MHLYITYYANDIFKTGFRQRKMDILEMMKTPVMKLSFKCNFGFSVRAALIHTYYAY